MDKFSDEKFSSFFFRSRTNKTHTTTPHSREEEFLTNRTERKERLLQRSLRGFDIHKKSARRRRQRRRSEIDRSRIAVMSSSVCVAKQAPIVVGSFGTKRRSPNNNSTARSIQRQTLVKNVSRRAGAESSSSSSWKKKNAIFVVVHCRVNKKQQRRWWWRISSPPPPREEGSSRPLAKHRNTSRTKTGGVLRQPFGR